MISCHRVDLRTEPRAPHRRVQNALSLGREVPQQNRHHLTVASGLIVLLFTVVPVSLIGVDGA
jgi:hypothetical protein